MDPLGKMLLAPLLNQRGQDTLKAQMIRGAIGTLFLKVASMALGFGTSLFLARALGAKEYGVYAYAISWALLLAVWPVMGFNVLLIRQVARYYTLRNWALLRGILQWSDRFVSLTSLAIALGFALVVWLLRGRFEPEVRLALWIAAMLVPLLAFLLLRRGALQGLGHVVEAQVPQMVVLPVLFLLFALVLYRLGALGGVVAVGAWFGAALFAVALSFFLLWRSLPKAAKAVPPMYSPEEWLRSAFPLFLASVAGMANRRVAAVMLGNMLGPEAVGIYDVALRGASFISFSLLAVNMPLAPAIARLYAAGERARLQRLVTRGARMALLGALPVAGGLIFFGRWVLLIFGPEFARASTTLAVLSVGQLANVGMGPVMLLLNMTAHEQDTAKGMGLAALLNVIFNATLIPILGVNGAALASALSMTVWNAWLSWIVYKRLGVCSTFLGCFPTRRIT